MAEAIANQAWVAAAADAVAAGYGYPEFLTAVDWPEQDQIEVILGLRDLQAADPRTAVRLLRTAVSRTDPQLATLRRLLPGLAWHERETHEMFGVRFTGDPDPDERSLLLAQTGQWPLRRTSALPARLSKPWPGLADPGDQPAPGQPVRRRSVSAVPGNNREWAQP